MERTKSSLMVPVVKKFKLHDQPKEAEYWRQQSYADRISALEQIRQEFHRWKYHAEPGFQRVYTIVKR